MQLVPQWRKWWAVMFLAACAALSFWKERIPVTQAVNHLQPRGAWTVSIGSQRFIVRIGHEQERAPGQTQPVVAIPPTAYTPQTDEERWAYDLATGLGNPAPSFETIQFIVAWQRGEGTQAANNPLATTQDATGSTCFNSVCVRNYRSREQGLDATVQTLMNGSYPSILQGLITNNPEEALNANELATWGTGLGNVEMGYRALIQNAPVLPTPDLPQAQPAAATELRQQIIQTALGQVGKPYILGTEGPDTFDCSGLVQWTYAQIGITTSRTTFTQLDALRPIDASQVQPGDMVYFQYPWDQHTGILADLDGDGHWDMIHAAAPGLGVMVTYDVFSDSFYRDAVIAYRTAL